MLPVRLRPRLLSYTVHKTKAQKIEAEQAQQEEATWIPVLMILSDVVFHWFSPSMINVFS